MGVLVKGEIWNQVQKRDLEEVEAQRERQSCKPGSTKERQGGQISGQILGLLTPSLRTSEP